jgi:hypothetical protein
MNTPPKKNDRNINGRSRRRTRISVTPTQQGSKKMKSKQEEGDRREEQ